MKFGKLAPKITPHTWRSMARLTAAFDPLGKPPDASFDYPGALTAPLGMYLNDRLGCCVCSDTAHTTMLRTANTSATTIIPTDDDVLKLYEAVGGYDPSDPGTDGGCVESDMEQYLINTGFLGHKLDATAAVNPHNIDHVKWTVQLFGSCRIGFQVPAFCMDQFNNGKPWDVTASGDQSIEGGHDVPIVGYSMNTFTVITWGKYQKMTRAFFEQYADEAHAELAYDWIREQGTAPSGFDLNTLAADMAEVA